MVVHLTFSEPAGFGDISQDFGFFPSKEIAEQVASILNRMTNVAISASISVK